MTSSTHDTGVETSDLPRTLLRPGLPLQQFHTLVLRAGPNSLKSFLFRCLTLVTYNSVLRCLQDELSHLRHLILLPANVMGMISRSDDIKTFAKYLSDTLLCMPKLEFAEIVHPDGRIWRR